MANDNFQGDNIHGDKVLGDKLIYEINHIDLDIGTLNSMLQNESHLIEEALSQLNDQPRKYISDEKPTPIMNKNLINGLEHFYINFIKHTEQKLALLDAFFKENDYIDEIENAADSIRIFISTYANRDSLKLEPYIFNIIIQQHTRVITDIKKKNIMKLLLYYLYRYCYIGLKNE